MPLRRATHSLSSSRFRQADASASTGASISHPAKSTNDSASMMSKQEAQSGEQKVVNPLVLRLFNKLPCNSGTELVALESDPAVQATVQSLLRLSRIRLSLVVQSLTNVLETLSKLSISASSLGDTSLDILHSQLYILYILNLCLTASWRLHSQVSPPPLSDLPRRWPDPYPFEDHLARQMLSVLLVYARMVSLDTDFGETSSSQQGKDRKGPNIGSSTSWVRSVSTASSSYSLGSKFLQDRTYPSISQRPSPGAAQSRQLSTTCPTVQCSISQMTKYIARIIFYLSASNWPLIIAQIKKRIGYLITTIDDSPDLTDLRLLEWSKMDQGRLTQALQEVGSTFLHIKRPAQITVATMLRKAIRNWIIMQPAEYESLIESGRKMDGDPDVLFDVLYSMSDLGLSSAIRRTKAFYPLMAMLLILFPDTLRKIVMGENVRGSFTHSKKSSFLESFKKGLNSSKGFEACVICYVDLMMAGIALSPRLESSGIRSLVSEIQNDLKNALFYSSLSNEISDQDVLVDGLVALYRLNPVTTGGLLFPKLWNNPSDASKVIVIKACIAIAIEGDRLPWFPLVDELMREVSPLIRGIIKSYVATLTSDHLAPRRPRGSIEIPFGQSDISLEILNLYMIEPQFAFSGVRLESGITSTDSILSLFQSLSSLMVVPFPEIIRVTAARTNASFIRYLDNMCRSGKMTSLASSASAGIWQMLLDIGRQMLFAFHGGDQDEVNISLYAMREIITSLVQFAEQHPTILFPSPKAQPAVMVISAAGFVSVVSPDVEQTTLTLPTLSTIGKLTRMAHQSATGELRHSTYSDLPTQRAGAFDVLASLPTAMGRQQQQRMIRRSLRPLAVGATLTVSVWVGSLSIWKDLTSRIIVANDGVSISSRDRRRVMTADIEGLTEEESKEWQNLVSYLCALAHVGIINYPPKSLSAVIGKEGLLPAAYDEDISDPFTIVEGFIKQCVELLISSAVPVRESVKASLGSELATSMCGTLVTQLVKLLSRAWGPAGPNTQEGFTILTEQAVTVLRLQVERLGPDDDIPAAPVDLGEILYMLGQYIYKLGRTDQALRLKTKYCQLVEMALLKKDNVLLENSAKFKNVALDWLTEWSTETLRSDVYTVGVDPNGKLQRELYHACLRAMVPISNGLVLSLTGEDEDSPQGAHQSRLFYKHYNHLVKVIERTNKEEGESLVSPTTHGQTKSSTCNDISTFAILSLSNLLSSNIDVGLEHCLALGYHEDSTLRIVFMQLLTNILQHGTRFVGPTAITDRTTKLYFENLSSSNLAFALAMVDVCPQTGAEVDELSTLLFRVFEAKGTLLALMRVLIEREVAMTNHESELFRANSITMRMITIFAKTYGYNYVRHTLQPLLASISERPAECSFELDPRKAAEGDDISDNADRLKLMCQALLDLICLNTSRVPVMFRALCHYIWEIVDDRFPNSRHSAIGSFIFLRFFCPAIVSPESVDLDVSPDTRETRRALLMVIKVVQNLANNVVFKEPHMKVLNTFLSDNIKQVTNFLSEAAIRPRTADLQSTIKMFQEDAEKSLDLDGDDAIIHRFVFKYQTKLEACLSSMPRSFHHSSSSKLVRTEFDGQGALERLRKVMMSTGPPTDAKVLENEATSQAYEEFMKHNQGRNIDAVKDVFYEGPASLTGRRIFYFVVAKVALIDYDLLAYHVFHTLERVNEFYDLIVDLTDFSSRTELPVKWIKNSLQMAPPELTSCLHTIILYSPNTYARKRLKRIVAELITINRSVGKNILAACSTQEIQEQIPVGEILLPPSTSSLSSPMDLVYDCISSLSDHGMQVPAVLKLGPECLQVATRRKQDVLTNLKSYIIDIVRLSDIDDVITGSEPNLDQLTIKYSQSETLTLITKNRVEIAYAIRSTRARLRDPVKSRALRPSDVPATLLNVALLNLSSSNETLRMGAYTLVNELSCFFKYDLASRVLKVSVGLCIPNNSLSWIYELSKAFANSAPHLTLDFLKEWTIGFSKADVPHKTASLYYVGPWLANLDKFSRPTNEDAEESVKQVGELVRSLISITVAERRRLHLSIQQHIWAALAKSHESLIDLMVIELIYGAINAGLGSDKTECIADILVSIASTNVRGKVAARLRKSLAQTYLKPSSHLTANTTWTEVCALARITLALGFNPTTAIDSQLFLPEIFHVITLLLGAGPLIMRQTVYGLLISMLNSLASNVTTGEMNGAALTDLLRRLQEPDTMTAFGVIQSHGHLELSGLPNKDETDVQLLDKIEQVSIFLGEVLEAGAISIDCANTWRARWMGLVAATCFQHNPSTQPQAFIVLGYLASDEIDDDLIYQILVAVTAVLSRFTESDSILLISMLRCLSNMVPGLIPESRYPTSLFWIAVSILQLGSIPLFGPALELMSTSLRMIIKSSGGIPTDEVMELLLDARGAVVEETQRLDQVAGVSFDTDIGFALVAIICKGVRHPSTRKFTIKTLFELLSLSASPVKASVKDEHLVDAGSVGYFITLLSISAGSGEEIKKVFEAAGLRVDDNAVDLQTISVFDLLDIPDNSTALLLISLVVSLLSGSGGSDSEKTVLFKILADASAEIPEILSMAYDSLIPRIISTITTTSNSSIIQASTTILERAFTDPNGYTIPPLSTLPSIDSNTSLHHAGHSKPYAPSISSNLSLSGQREQVLEDLGMKGLGELAFPQVKTDQLSMMAKWVAATVDRFIT
ncbi:uncharacterized protein L203_103118 [Cryptococcus depauperatus CBS 7841]|uniref:Ras-GAP domain-containing protein n=1 Tax=Cryptococcus depauperatus CBS 7841 TaxID=1295531 RepID=A0AAJ8JT13_9TREE